MEVKVDSALIKAERKKRAWSQEHLAMAAGLGARTVQRIESTGVASYQSVQAISSALEIDVQSTMLTGDAVRSSTVRPRRTFYLATGLSMFVAAGIALFVANGVVAGPLHVGFQVVREWNCEDRDYTEQSAKVGVERASNCDVTKIYSTWDLDDQATQEITVDGEFKLKVTVEPVTDESGVKDDEKVQISFEVSEYASGEFVPAVNPPTSMIATLGRSAAVIFMTNPPEGALYTIHATPRLSEVEKSE